MGPATSCRPHSHRRVVFSSGKPSEERLASDVSPPNKSADFVTGARAGIRFRLPAVSFLPGRGPSAMHLPSGGTETNHSLMIPFLKRTDLQPKLSTSPSIQDRTISLTSEQAIAFFSNNRTCVLPKPSACPVSKTAWTEPTASVVRRNSREINSLEPDFRLGFRPFRCLETAPEE